MGWSLKYQNTTDMNKYTAFVTGIQALFNSQYILVIHVSHILSIKKNPSYFVIVDIYNNHN